MTSWACRAYSTSLLRAIIACNHLPLFKIFSKCVHFCPSFQIFCPFSIFLCPFSGKLQPCPNFRESAWACKCVFYRQKHNATGGPTLWNWILKVFTCWIGAQRIDRENVVIWLVITFTPRVMVIKCYFYVFCADDVKIFVTVWVKYLSAFKWSYLALSQKYSSVSFETSKCFVASMMPIWPQYHGLILQPIYEIAASKITTKSEETLKYLSILHVRTVR